jgi:hypothetical protein
MSNNDTVVLDVAGFSYNTEEGGQLSPPDGKLRCAIGACNRSDSMWIGLIGFPGSICATCHEDGQSFVLANIDLQFMTPHFEELAGDSSTW